MLRLRSCGRGPEGFRRLQRLLLACIPALVVLLAGTEAHAYPWMIRHGYGGCTTCHMDPSGGELLTRYGRAQGDLLLRMHYGRQTASLETPKQKTDSFDSFDSFDDDTSAPAKPKPKPAPPPPKASGPSPSAGFLWGLLKPPDWLLVGGSYRHMTVIRPAKRAGQRTFWTFPMMADVYGGLEVGGFRAEGSLGVAKVPAQFAYTRAAQITTNQGDQFNLISRTHWLGWAFSNEKYLLRAGRINLPFGVRIPEHVMWVRAATRTDRESEQQHGVAFAYNGDVFRGEIMAIAGNYQINPDRFRERGYSGYLEWMLADWAAVGASSLVTHAQADITTLEDQPTLRQAHGLFARVAVVPQVVVLAEGDALLKSRHDPGYAGFLQADYEPVQGLHFDATGEVVDEGYEQSTLQAKSPGFGQPRFGGWLSAFWFFLPHFEARLDGVVRQQDSFELLAQLHVYL